MELYDICHVVFTSGVGQADVQSYPIQDIQDAFFPTIGADRLGQQAQVWSSRERL